LDVCGWHGGCKRLWQGCDEETDLRGIKAEEKGILCFAMESPEGRLDYQRR